jgi:two-component system sensor histidine kinase KdpD
LRHYDVWPKSIRSRSSDINGARTARGDRINPRDADALQQNIKLAESLGATVVRVKAGKPADGLIAFAQREGVTHVIFGQSARTRWELVLRGSTLDKLSAVPDAAVLVVPLTETYERPADADRSR